MKNRNKALIVGGCALLVLLFLLVWAITRKDRYQWKETFRPAEGQPYDVSIFHELLRHYGPEGLEDVRERPRDALGSALGRQGANYVFVGEFPHYDPEDVDSILAFVAAGGHALVSAKSFWLNASSPTTCLSTATAFQAAVYDQRVALWLMDPVVAEGGADSLSFAPKGKPENYAWSAFDTSYAEAVAAECRALGAQALVVQADVSQDADARALAEATRAHFGRADVLVNNAGTTKFVALKNLDGLDADDFGRFPAGNFGKRGVHGGNELLVVEHEEGRLAARCGGDDAGGAGCFVLGGGDFYVDGGAVALGPAAV